LDFRHRVGHGKYDGVGGHPHHHFRGDGTGDTQAQKHIRIHEGIGQGTGLLNGKAGFGGVEVGTAGTDNALRIAQN